MIKHFLSIALISFVLSNLSCKKSITDPQPDELQPGRRDYVWKVDTLKHPSSFQTLMRSIWGTSSKNLFAVGFNDDYRRKMYHFDGVSWTPVKLSVAEGGFINIINGLSTVYGFSENNIFAVGSRYYDSPTGTGYVDSSLIIHYDGSAWKESLVGRGAWLNVIWGADPNNVWAMGGIGSVFFFNGLEWTKIRMQDDIQFHAISGTSKDNIFSLAIKLDVMPYDSIMSILFHYDGYAWKEIDSGYEFSRNFYRTSVWSLDENNIFITGYGIYKKTGNDWEKIFDNGQLYSKIKGTSERNMFVVYESVQHYNGTNWAELTMPIPPTFPLTDIWTDGKEVFIVGNDGNTTYIFHGK